MAQALEGEACNQTSRSFLGFFQCFFDLLQVLINSKLKLKSLQRADKLSRCLLKFYVNFIYSNHVKLPHVLYLFTQNANFINHFILFNQNSEDFHLHLHPQLHHASLSNFFNYLKFQHLHLKLAHDDAFKNQHQVLMMKHCFSPFQH